MKNKFSIRQLISDKIILSRHFYPPSAVSNVIYRIVLPDKRAGNGALFLLPFPALIRLQKLAAFYHKLFVAPCPGRPHTISPYISAQLLHF